MLQLITIKAAMSTVLNVIFLVIVTILRVRSCMTLVKGKLKFISYYF
jgi:hypothetical protein